MTVAMIRPSAKDGNDIGKRRVLRASTDPLSDLLYDDLTNAPLADKPAIAERLIERLAAAEAEYPWHVAPRAQSLIGLVTDACGLDEDGEQAQALYDRREAIRSRRDAELGASKLGIVTADITAVRADMSFDKRAQDGMIERIIQNYSWLIGNETELPPDQITESLFYAATWRREDDERAFDASLRDARRGRRDRYLTIEMLEVEDVSSSEFYEVDLETASPSPWQFDDEKAEREADERRKEAERIVRQAEGVIAGNRRLSLEEACTIARATADQTRGCGLPGHDLHERLIAAFGKREGFNADDIELLIEWSVEEAREPLARPYDDALVAAQVTEIAARSFGKAGDIVGPIFTLGVDLEALVRTPTAPVQALAALKAPSAVVEAPAAPAIVPDGEAAPSKLKSMSPTAQREADMEALTHVPGLVGNLVDWFSATNASPNRTLAFAGALALVGTLGGRIYETETSLRTNIYMLGLAPSGFGKDHVRSCINILVENARCGEWLGGAEIASGTAMRRRVEDHPAILYVIDEFGHTMRKMCDDRNPHHAQIRSLLLQYFEAAGDVFRGADYAGERAKPVFNPNVSLYGLSNPDTFWSACQGSATVDGLLARFMPFSVGSMRPAEARPTAKKSEPPAALIDGLRILTRSKVGGNMNNRLADGSTKSKALVVPFGSGAEAAYYTARSKWKDAAYAKRGRPEESIFGRIVENALKVAMIIAIGVDADKPVITVERFEHGLAVARHCAETTLHEIKGRLADNDRQREHVDVLRMIVESGWAGIGNTELRKRIRGRFNERRLIEILESLDRGSKEIVAKLRPTKGRPAMKYVAIENLSADEAEGS